MEKYDVEAEIYKYVSELVDEEESVMQERARHYAIPVHVMPYGRKNSYDSLSVHNKSNPIQSFVASVAALFQDDFNQND